jgi:hypothetical protein
MYSNMSIVKSHRKSSGTVLKKFGEVLTTDILNEFETAGNELLTITLIK